MLFDLRLENNAPESIIIDILSKKPRLTTSELYDFYLAKAPKKITVQGFYRIIRQMLSSRVLVKEGTHVSLDSFWINNLISLAETVKQVYLENKVGVVNVLLEEGETKTFEFENIMAMDNFWSHGLNTVINFYTKNDHPDKNGYSHHYFSIFQVGRTSSENVLASTYQSANDHWYMASGSSAFLNKLVAKLIEVENYHQFIYDFEKFQKEQALKNNIIEKNYWVTVVGDFIFEAHIPKYLFNIFEKIYQEVNSLSEFNTKQFNSLFLEPGKTTLTISRNKKRADVIRENVKALYAEK